MLLVCGRALRTTRTTYRILKDLAGQTPKRYIGDGPSQHDETDTPSSRPLIYPQSSSTQHSNLSTFLEYAKRTGLDEKSSVYVGTHYEYTVASSLAKYGFYLRRIGGASDFGTDLLGTWTPPTTNRAMRVLVQCKAGLRIGPHYVREMEGAFVGAPVGWRGPGVLGLLVSEKPATKGVRDSLARSHWPMGFINCSKDGTVQQMLWNRRAEAEGLDGFGVVAQHGAGHQETRLVLVKNGKVLPFVEQPDE
ncbi:hypothetical protein HJFPF1_00511 [Paramyrothecium foliicola]|nr:hypothetical protein HJFPF1_00511 [Paramyrothecium foliicola]